MKIVIVVLTIFTFLILPVGLENSMAQPAVKTFEERLNDQLKKNNSNQENSSTIHPDVVINSSILSMPRNSTLSDIQAGNESIKQIHNNSVQNMAINSEKTRQNISDLLSILK